MLKDCNCSCNAQRDRNTTQAIIFSSEKHSFATLIGLLLKCYLTLLVLQWGTLSYTYLSRKKNLSVDVSA